MSRKPFSALLAFAITGLCAAQSPVKIPSDAEIRKMLVERVDGDRWGTGIVVGIVAPEGRRIIGYGTMDKGDGRPVDGNTIFEIGSITKVFTSLALANIVQLGKVSLTEPVQDLLPTGVSVPSWHGHRITLVDLATQTSGLPFFPTDLPEIDSPELPVRLPRYTERELFRFISRYKLLHDTGVHWEYSNLGVGLLGTALAMQRKTSYAHLIQSQITTPLGMPSTYIRVPRRDRKRVSAGHDDDQQAIASIPFPECLDGAGALHSSANDLLTLLETFIGTRQAPLSPAMKSMFETTRPAADWLQYLGGKQALGWWVIGSGSSQIYAHAGETRGFTSSIAFNPVTKIGVVALSNGASGGDQIAMHLLLPSWPYSHRAPPMAEPKEVFVSQGTLDRYVGKYEAGPNTILVIARRGDHLDFLSPGSSMVTLHPTDRRSFFIKKAGVQVSFVIGADGMATSLEIHIPGLPFAIPAHRLP